MNPATRVAEERNAGTEQHGVNVHPDLVDDACSKQRLGQLTAAHDADALSRLLLEPPHELACVVPDEMCAVAHAGERPREDVGGDRAHSGVPSGAAHLHRDLPRLATHQHRVDGCPVARHGLLNVLAEVQPVHGTVGRRDEAVETAGRAIGDDTHSRIPPSGGYWWRQSKVYTIRAFSFKLYDHLETSR